MVQRKKGEERKLPEGKRLVLKRKSLKDLDAKEDRNPRGGGWGSRTSWKNLTPAMSQSSNG